MTVCSQNEKFTKPADNHNTLGEYNPLIHSLVGINGVSLQGFPSGYDSMITNTTTQLKEFPYNLDYNTGTTLGIGHTQSTINNGARSSSAVSYLADKYLARPNLHILVHAYVTRVLQSGTEGGKKAFRTVEFTQDDGSTLNTLAATKELILSAGAVNSPAILMHSGIGDAATLTSLGITPLVNLPSVGKNLTDHPLSANVWLVNSTDTLEKYAREPGFSAALDEWKMSRTGPFTASFLSWLGFQRLSNDVIKKNGDASSGPNTPHYELFFINGFITTQPLPPQGNFMTIAFATLQPTSRGTISITSNNPLEVPVIDPNLLGTELDFITMKEAFLATRRFISAPAFKGYILGEVTPLPDDAAIEAYLRGSTGTVFHPVSTASMSPIGASWGVTDPDLHVKGVAGLRVVDASVFPHLPAGHTQVPTYLVAERAADLIKASR